MAVDAITENWKLTVAQIAVALNRRDDDQALGGRVPGQRRAYEERQREVRLCAISLLAELGLPNARIAQLLQTSAHVGRDRHEVQTDPVTNNDGLLRSGLQIIPARKASDGFRLTPTGKKHQRETERRVGRSRGRDRRARRPRRHPSPGMRRARRSVQRPRRSARVVVSYPSPNRNVNRTTAHHLRLGGEHEETLTDDLGHRRQQADVDVTQIIAGPVEARIG